MSSQNPSLPPPPVRFPARAVAAHVQAAVVQAKLPSFPSPRGPAPHVQAAVVQAKTGPVPSVRGPAAHVQAAVARVVQARPRAAAPAPPPPAPAPARVQAPQHGRWPGVASHLQPSRPIQPAPAPQVRQTPAQAAPRTIQRSQDDDLLDFPVKKKRKTTHGITFPSVIPGLGFDLSPFQPSLIPPSSRSILTPPPYPRTLSSGSTGQFPSDLPDPYSMGFYYFSSPPFTPDFPPFISNSNLTISNYTPVPSSKPTPSSVVTVYDPTTAELSDLAQSAQNLFAYSDSSGLVNQRTVRLYDVKGLTYNKYSNGTVHAAVQIDRLTPMIVSSGEYGTPTKVVRNWRDHLTWTDRDGVVRTGFTSPDIGDSSISFTIPRKTSKKTQKPGHRWSAHAEVNAYRELYKLYQGDQLTPSSIEKFRMATNVAHCAECWWAAHALFQHLGIDVGKIETSSPTEKVLFQQWTEPWENFYKDLGMSSSPFRGSNNKLNNRFKRNQKVDALELNSLQNHVYFL